MYFEFLYRGDFKTFVDSGMALYDRDAKGIFVQCLSDICNIDDCISGEATGICPYSD